jgi:hypothetical protein
MIRWSKIIDELFRAYCDFMERHDKRRQPDELAGEAEADQRHLTYIWEGRNPNIKTKGQ